MASSSPATSCCISTNSDSDERGPSTPKAMRPPRWVYGARAGPSLAGRVHYPPPGRDAPGGPWWWDDDVMGKTRSILLVLASLAWIGALATTTAHAQAPTRATVLQLK